MAKKLTDHTDEELKAVVTANDAEQYLDYSTSELIAIILDLQRGDATPTSAMERKSLIDEIAGMGCVRCDKDVNEPSELFIVDNMAYCEKCAEEETNG